MTATATRSQVERHEYKFVRVGECNRPAADSHRSRCVVRDRGLKGAWFAAATWAVVMALSPILQIREILRRRSFAGLSLGYFGILMAGFALWVCYGVATHDLPLVIPNCVAFLVMGCTIAVASDKR